MACIQAGLHPSEISAYNCHARATLYGDAAEAVAIRTVMAAGEKYPTFEQFANLTTEEIVACRSEPIPAKED